MPDCPDIPDIPDTDTDYLAQRIEVGLPTNGGTLNESNKSITLHPAIAPKKWRPLQDWRFLACSSVGLSIASIAAYWLEMPTAGTLCFVFAFFFAVNFYRKVFA